MSVDMCRFHKVIVVNVCCWFITVAVGLFVYLAAWYWMKIHQMCTVAEIKAVKLYLFGSHTEIKIISRIYIYIYIYTYTHTGAGHIIRISSKSLFISLTPFKKWNLYNVYIHSTQTDIFQVFISFNFDDYNWQLMKTPNSVSQKIRILLNL